MATHRIGAAAALLGALLVGGATADEVVLDDGTVLEGVIERETDREIVVRTITGPVTVPRDWVVEIRRKPVPEPDPLPKDPDPPAETTPDFPSFDRWFRLVPEGLFEHHVGYTHLLFAPTGNGYRFGLRTTVLDGGRRLLYASELEVQLDPTLALVSFQNSLRRRRHEEARHGIVLDAELEVRATIGGQVIDPERIALGSDRRGLLDDTPHLYLSALDPALAERIGNADGWVHIETGIGLTGRPEWSFDSDTMIATSRVRITAPGDEPVPDLVRSLRLAEENGDRVIAGFSIEPGGLRYEACTQEEALGPVEKFERRR